MRNSPSNRIVRMLLILVVIYATIAVAAFVLAERLLFMPPRASYVADAEYVSRIPVNEDDFVALAHLPNDSAQFTILYSHGNAEDLGHVMPVLRHLWDAGFGVIGYDYRGYGRSTGGRPTVSKATEDAEAVYRFAVEELGIRPEQLILHGRSLGSGPALQVAARHPVAGIVLESAFTSTYRVMTRIRLLPFDRFPNASLIQGIRSPVLVIHGTEDEVIPPAHGKTLFALAPEPKQFLWVDGAGHNDLVRVAGVTYTSALIRFASLIDETSARRSFP